MGIKILKDKNPITVSNDFSKTRTHTTISKYEPITLGVTNLNEFDHEKYPFNKNVNIVEHAIVYSGIMGWSVSTWIAIVLGVVVLGESFIIYRNYKREKYIKKEESFFD